MKRSRYQLRLALSALFATLATLAACAPFGAEMPSSPPRSALATTTAAALATYEATSGANATPLADLPALQPDPGWVAVVQIPDGAKLGGPSVSGGTPGAGIATTTMTLGHFNLSSAATVKLLFGCMVPRAVHATVEIGVSDGESVQIQCDDTEQINSSEMTFSTTSAGQTLTVTATISTDGVTPQWHALVEQPK